MNKRLLLSVFFGFIYLSCSTKLEIVNGIVPNPPNVVQIIDFLFVDSTEMTNIGYLEYLSYLRQHYSNDKEYIKALPDTMVWLQIDTCLINYVFDYLRNPEYYYYPVVGVSYTQALAYSKWRSDRVMEMILITNGKLKYIEANKDDENFTIEKYFNNQYHNYQRDPTIEYYPEFRLPTLEEWNLIIDHQRKVFRSISCETNEDIKYLSDESICDMKDNIISSTKFGCTSSRKDKLHNLQGNVCEWLHVGKMCGGGSWQNTLFQIEQSTVFSANKPSAWVGFRNVFTWKKYK